jgi:signal transduction histidine kinase/CheY-like chemotaxis protein
MSGSQKPYRLLILEDDLIDRQHIARLLSQSSLADCEVKHAGLLKEALTILEEGQFDAVLSDLNVPDSDGMNTLVQIQRKHPDTAIIVVTGESNEELGIRAIAEGAEDYLAKSQLDVNCLAKSIRHAVERKRIERKIWSQNEFLFNILESLTYPFYVVDVSDYSVVIANSAAVKGHLNDQTPCYMLSHKKDAPCEGPNCPCPLEEVKRTGQPMMVEHVHQDATLGTRYFEYYAYPLFDEAGRVSRVIEYYHDVTNRKQAEKEKDLAEAQLRHAQKMDAIGTLAGGIAHDFNNMLGAMIGYANLALGDVPEDSTAHRNLCEVLTAANRAKDLVRQILTFGRENEERQKPIRIAPIVREVLKTIQVSLPKNIEISTHIPDSSGMIMANVAQIHQILLNLCTNAAHAMEAKGGLLDVTIKEVEIQSPITVGHISVTPGSYIQLIVTDTGCGMSPEVLSHVFEPFFTTREVGKGTGMGLAVVDGIVRKHRATITVNSREGIGTSFTIFFPSLEAALSNDGPSQNADGASDIPTILVVDDEALMVDVTRQILERLGYIVVGRTSSEEALQAFREDPDRFDLVITDHRMPKLTGVQLARELMAVRPGVPIILCTGFSDDIGPEEAKRVGIRAYMMKPVTIKDMDNLIKSILKGSPDRQEVTV